jgi:hypothetical protein
MKFLAASFRLPFVVEAEHGSGTRAWREGNTVNPPASSDGDQARFRAATAPLGSQVDAANGHRVAARDDDRNGERGRTRDGAMVMLICAELGFMLAALLWTKLTAAQALQMEIGATLTGVLAFHGRGMLIANGRRMLDSGDRRGL